MTMNRNEAFKIMRQGGYINHPILKKANAGPLSMVGNTICGKNSEPLTSEWKNQIDSNYFNTDWIVCDENGNELNM